MNNELEYLVYIDKLVEQNDKRKEEIEQLNNKINKLKRTIITINVLTFCILIAIISSVVVYMLGAS